ncbi:hypothetical protein BST17_08520 [Mycolicibacterium bacteremicum]|uniref:Uncharacterized protein n=1 Tax=Mycolicibacterium bacteremicum TaxID=564198 RepID=A0A1W9Z187_MYCBA|nr:hypothetical protein BST17_08520 [Mycolicibacterium bacteremicum]
MYREGPNGEIITVTEQPVKVTGGILTAELEPGVAVIQNPDGERWTVTVPDEDASLWEVIAAAVAFPPQTSQQAVASAITAFLDNNPIESVTTNNISDAGAVGKTAVQAQTQSQLRAAAGAPGLTAAKNVYTGQQEINGGFTNSFKTALWIAPPTELNPTNLTQGLYVQHRIEGDLGAKVHDGAASELRFRNVSNPGTGSAAHECSLVVTGGVNDIGYTAAVLANFHTAGTPTGNSSRVSMFHAQQIPPLAAGFTIDAAISLKLEQQIVGTENWTIYAPDGNNVLGPLWAKNSTTPAVTARAHSGMAAGTDVVLIQNAAGTGLIRFTNSGTGGIGSPIGNTGWWVNNNISSDTVVPVRLRAHTSQTANMFEVQESGGTAHVALSAATASLRSHLNLGSTGSAASEVRLYNTADQTTNYERARFYWSGNTFNIATEGAGTGSARALIFNGANSTLTLGSNGIALARGSTSVATIVGSSATLTASSASQSMMAVTPTVNQSGTASYVALLVNATETSTGSGSKTLIDAQVGSASKFKADNAGRVTLNNGPQIIPGTGTPEGAVTAPVGSLFLRSDGGAGTSHYVKESGSGNTGWVAK